MRVQRNWAGIQVWQRNEDQEMEEFNEWSWAAVSLCFPSMWQTAQFPALTPKHISRVCMYSKCHGCVSFPQVLDYFHGFKRVSIHSKICFLLSHTFICYTLKLSPLMRPSRLLPSGAVLAVVLGSSQLFSLFSLALPQVVLTHSAFTCFPQHSTCLWSQNCGSGASLGRKVLGAVTCCF